MMTDRAEIPGRLDRRGLWRCLLAFGTAGVLVRAVLAVAWPTIQRPDEIFQNLEPAHRLWTGWGVVTWEWRDGIRSWLFPDFLFGIMRATSLLGLPAAAALPLIWMALSVVATGVVVVGVALGWRRFGLTGAVLCGVLCAFWPDLVYFGPKTLLEVQAGNLLVLAAGLASFETRGRDALRMAAIGMLLGLAFDLRLQLAPALVLIAAWVGRLEIRRWLPLALGAALPLAALGVSDAVAWGSPFQSVWKNIAVNFVENKSELYGVWPVYWYLAQYAHRYGAAAAPLAVFFCLGARRAPLLAAVPVVVVASHSLIAHKELSFVYAALPTAIVTVGLGTAWFVQRMHALLDGAVRAPVLLGSAGLAWLTVSLLTGYASEPYRQTARSWAGLKTLWDDVRSRPDLCGLGLYGRAFPWAWTQGYTGLRRAMPIYLLLGPEALARAKPGFNYVIAAAEDAPNLRDYVSLDCSGQYCLLRREQGCSPVPELEINAALARFRQ